MLHMAQPVLNYVTNHNVIQRAASNLFQQFRPKALGYLLYGDVDPILYTFLASIRVTYCTTSSLYSASSVKMVLVSSWVLPALGSTVPNCQL